MHRSLAAFAAGAFVTLAAAQGPAGGTAATYPSKAVRVIVPFAPGGQADLLGRVVGQTIADAWDQTAVVEHKVGAAGNIGVDEVAKSAPDGYTVGIVPAGNIAVNPALFPNLPYKASELTPVVLLATVENVLIVNAKVPATDLKELIALALQKPGTLSFASTGAGSQAHLAGELLALDSGVALLHVPYKGAGPALNDVVAGQVSMMFVQASSAIPFIRSGKLRAIGVASLRRSAALPQVPTIAEQGLPGFEAVSWYALMAPAATPRDIIEKLNVESVRMLASPELREHFAARGMEAGGGRPLALAARIQLESVRWADVIRRRNIKPE